MASFFLVLSPTLGRGEESDLEPKMLGEREDRPGVDEPPAIIFANLLKNKIYQLRFGLISNNDSHSGILKRISTKYKFSKLRFSKL